MKTSKRLKLEAAGWAVGSAVDFLGLSKEEETLVEMKLALADSIRERRQKENVTQQELARRIGSSQSRVAKMEAADSSVSMDLLVRSLVVLGETRQSIGRIVARKPHALKRTPTKR
jgi:DNA-binding XRE family transcriptional regulator